ncbi:pentatricopeptide repeat domain-containing protein [Ophiostoma piceae UAMH 11346]|uniref:Pentatricopeptide repeat domain-containing protein n=1 Tax=Ophiostoma piceae (strain UAMH 11346) TaxID=1262450 RepID=S3BXN4_OPHP1|nr:pentatricopeptide repeat domain-containing protein [Ophiostoma piceae UAMH 11346]
MQSLWSWGPQGHICSSCRRECLRRGPGTGLGASIGRTTGRTRAPPEQNRSFHAGALGRRAAPVVPNQLGKAPAPRRPRRRTAEPAASRVEIQKTHAAPYSTDFSAESPETRTLRETPEGGAEQKAGRQGKAVTEPRVDNRTALERQLDDARADLSRIMRESIGPNFNLPVYLFPPVSGARGKVKRRRRENPNASAEEQSENGSKDIQEELAEALAEDEPEDVLEDAPGDLRPDEIPDELQEYARYARSKDHKATPVSIPAPTIANTRTVVSRSSIIDALNSICVSHAQLRQHEAKADQREAYLTWLHKQFGLTRRWWLQRPKLTEGLDALGDALTEEEYATQTTLLQGQREPQIAIHFSRMVDTTNILVDDLMIEAYRLWDPMDPDLQRKRMGNPDSAWNALRMLRMEGFPSYQLPNLDPEATTYARLAASDASRQIFQNWLATLRFNTANGLGKVIYSSIRNLRRIKSKDDIKARNAEEIHGWVAKLCFNMLVNKSPPGIHNYHALIFGFTYLGLHTLSQIVVDSLLLRTRFLPTQQTVALLLHQSRARGDMIGFYRTVRRIVALDSRGMKYRRRSISDAQAGKSEYHEWARTSDINLIDGYVVQRSDVEGPILDAVLKGLLSLDQVRHATVVYAASLNESTQVDPKLLHTFLNSVLDTVDIPAARALLQGLASNAALITPLLMPDMGDPKHVSATSARKLAIKLRLLLSIAVAPEPPLRKWQHDSQMLVDYKPQKRIANPYMRQMQRRRRHLSQAKIQDEMRQAQTESGQSGQAQIQDTDQQSSEQAGDNAVSNPDESEKQPAEVKPGMSWDEFQYRNRTGTFRTDFNLEKKPKTSQDARPWKDDTEKSRGAFRLTQALFVADTDQYLSRLDRILQSAINAAATSTETAAKDGPAETQSTRAMSSFAKGADAWSGQLTNLANQAERQERKQDQYRRMAQLKAVDQMADSVFSACSHVMESFMETVTEDAAAIKAASAERAIATGEPPVFQSIFSCYVETARTTLMASLQSFLQRASVPFGIRLAAFNATTGLQERGAAPKHKKKAAADAQPQPTEPTESIAVEDGTGNDKVAMLLAKQVAMLERHLGEDTPIVSGLLEGRLKDILTQSLFPDYHTTLSLGEMADVKTQKSLDDANAKARARMMPVEALVQARMVRLKEAADAELVDTTALLATRRLGRMASADSMRTAGRGGGAGGYGMFQVSPPATT